MLLQPAPEILLALLVALAADALIGDPDWLWKRMPHPVVWFGRLIGLLDRRFNREEDDFATRRFSGLVAVGLLALAAIAGAAFLEAILGALPFGPLWIGLAASVLIAQRSLYEHVARVAQGFSRGGIEGARAAVAMIVGRDPQSLDQAGVSRAAIESAAENYSDGIVAPVFWFALFGLPGLAFYKAVNTADSMIGHRNARFEAFGWAAARLDDVLNLVPARLAGLIVAFAGAVVGASPGKAIGIMLRDARLHRSPNAGWPEAAMAGALGIVLAGPRRYGERIVDDAYLHAEGRDARPGDIDRALAVLMAACLLHAGLYAAIFLVAAALSL